MNREDFSGVVIGDQGLWERNGGGILFDRFEK